MGLKIICDDATPLPRQCRMVLTCDGEDHGMFQTTQVFNDPRGCVEQYAAAMRSGWMEVATGDVAFLCPMCSGKKGR